MRIDRLNKRQSEYLIHEVENFMDTLTHEAQSYVLLDDVVELIKDCTDREKCKCRANN